MCNLCICLLVVTVIICKFKSYTDILWEKKKVNAGSIQLQIIISNSVLDF